MSSGSMRLYWVTQPTPPSGTIQAIFWVVDAEGRSQNRSFIALELATLMLYCQVESVIQMRAKGYFIYRARVRHGGRKRPVSKGIVYGKPTNQCIKQMIFQCIKRSVAESVLEGNRVVSLLLDK